MTWKTRLLYDSTGAASIRFDCASEGIRRRFGGFSEYAFGLEFIIGQGKTRRICDWQGMEKRAFVSQRPL